MWVRDPGYCQLIWAENQDVCRPSALCFQVATANPLSRRPGTCLSHRLSTEAVTKTVEKSPGRTALRLRSWARRAARTRRHAHRSRPAPSTLYMPVTPLTTAAADFTDPPETEWTSLFQGRWWDKGWQHMPHLAYNSVLVTLRVRVAQALPCDAQHPIGTESTETGNSAKRRLYGNCLCYQDRLV